jgi:hypothetical protein
MPFCPSCGAEFRAGYTRCNTCQVALVASLEALKDQGEEDESGGLRFFIGFTNEAQAAYARQLLDVAGVPTVVRGGHAASVEDCQHYQLFVHEDFVEAAQAVLDSYHSPSLVTGEIEDHLRHFQQALDAVERERADLAPHLRAVTQSIEHLQTELQAFNRKLDEEG